jgi:hypothetical protein
VLSRDEPSVVHAVLAYDASEPARLRITEGGNPHLTRANHPVFVAWYQSHAGGLTVAGQPRSLAAEGRRQRHASGRGVQRRGLLTTG